MEPDYFGVVLKQHRILSGFPECIPPPGNLLYCEQML
jgi:hypothetical protein